MHLKPSIFVVKSYYRILGCWLLAVLSGDYKREAGDAVRAVETYDMACEAGDVAKDMKTEDLALLFTKRGGAVGIAGFQRLKLC